MAFVRLIAGPDLPSRCADGDGIRLWPPEQPVPPLLAVTVTDGDETLGWIGVADLPEAGFERGEMRDFLLDLSRSAAIPAVNVRRHAAALDMAMRDPLTGLFNRRALEVFLSREAQIAIRYQRPLSVVLVDLDQFKEVNDRHGHAAGDKVLRAVGRTLCSTVRRADLVVRFGGDEFVVLLPDTPLSAARQLAQRLGRALRSTRVRLDGADRAEVQLVASLGVANLESCGGSADRMLRAADAAMYEAKQRRRRAPSVIGVVDAARADASPRGNRP